MKKIMFNDKHGLTQSVLEGRKTQTRRIITHPKIFHGKDVCGFYVCKRVTDGVITEVCMYDENEISIDEGQILPKYMVGEVVAVAQSYFSIVNELENNKNATCEEHYEKNVEKAIEYLFLHEHPGFCNKMFVSADMMPHQIRITNVRVERLQDISDGDCLKEGIADMGTGGSLRYSYDENVKQINGDNITFLNNFATAKEAFASLIDKVSGKGTWDRNPYVFVYDFKLVK